MTLKACVHHRAVLNSPTVVAFKKIPYKNCSVVTEMTKENEKLILVLIFTEFTVQKRHKGCQNQYY